ncbi:uncharacterized protein [Aristolochia californica]|uniref:uncharacterized protein n=1 Tax=Aristolochia californica TaxID=171875 RepID=UPI0035DB08E7
MDRDLLLQHITKRLRTTQVHMKYVYDKGHREVSNEVGDYVWLRLQPYSQQFLEGPPRHKISPKIFGHFPVLRLLGLVTYQLQLPAMAKLHVSILKPHTRSLPTSTPFLPPVDNRDIILTPAAVLRAWLINYQWEIRVQWTDTEPKAATWEHVDIFKQVYPAFELEDKLFLLGEADVVDSIAHRVTQRRRQ